MQIVLHTPDDTRTAGAMLGRLLRAGDVIALIGDLGMGKTTFAQGVAQGMGITDAVTSPTFTLVQEYGRRLPLFHFDPYRLDQPEAIYDFGFEEYLERGGVVVVEWADRIAALLPPERLTVTLREQETANAGASSGQTTNDKQQTTSSIEGTGDTEQEIEEARLMAVEARGERYERLLAELAAQYQENRAVNQDSKTAGSSGRRRD